MNTAASRPPQDALSPETRLKLFRLMVECRALEKRAYDLFMQNLIKGTSHLALGQEAVAAGFGVAMRPDDYTFCTYRGHNHTYVRGVGLELDQLVDLLPRAGFDPCEAADAQLSVDGLEAVDAPTAQVLLPALGLALGRMA